MSTRPTQEDVARKMAQKEFTAPGTTERLPPESLDEREVWWSNLYEWLEAHGYRLRPRYAPGWIPSWKKSGKPWLECEDSRNLEVGHMIDAERISDGRYVSLKRVKKSAHPHEVDIGLYFSSDRLFKHPENHCVPLLEVLSLDDHRTVIIVMPLLRSYTDPHFDTFGEAIECFRQLFEGLRFMHKHHVAHRNCMSLNLMLDPSWMYPDSFHPMETYKKRDYSGPATFITRTENPPKYYFIDFGISRKYDPAETNPKEVPVWGDDKEVPEFQNSNEPCNPFPTDVFYIGNAIKKDFIKAESGFDFMIPLVESMIQSNPLKRPTMDKVVIRFDRLCASLACQRKLRLRIVDYEEDAHESSTHFISHWKRRIRFIARGT